jgi:hypothetical protein
VGFISKNRSFSPLFNQSLGDPPVVFSPAGDGDVHMSNNNWGKVYVIFIYIWDRPYAIESLRTPGSSLQVL